MSPLTQTIDDRMAERRMVVEMGRMYDLWKSGEAPSPSDLDVVLAGDAVLRNMDPTYGHSLASDRLDAVADELYENAEGLTTDEDVARFVLARLREGS
jgi:hypothetical protein